MTATVVYKIYLENQGLNRTTLKKMKNEMKNISNGKPKVFIHASLVHEAYMSQKRYDDPLRSMINYTNII